MIRLRPREASPESRKSRPPRPPPPARGGPGIRFGVNRSPLLLLGLLPALLMAVPRLDVPAAGEGPILRVAAARRRGRGGASTSPRGPSPGARRVTSRSPAGPVALCSSAPREGTGPVPRARWRSAPPAPRGARRGARGVRRRHHLVAPSRAAREHILRSVLLRPGDWVTFRSERGGAGRLEFEAPFTESGWRLKILTVPGIAAHVPRPPEAPPVMEKDGWTVRLSCAPLSRLPEGRSPVHVLDREQPFGSGRWETDRRARRERLPRGSSGFARATDRCPSRAFACVAGSTAVRSPSRGRPSPS